MRDVLFIPFDNDELIVIASDNSGAIGMKEADVVKVPYKTVAYYSFRVAAMECMAAGGAPFAITVQNFCGDEAWAELISGIEQGLNELGFSDVKITGSTESNFTLVQSAVGLTVLGIMNRQGRSDKLQFREDTRIAVIGSPLVGNEVLQQAHKIAPLSVFKQIASIEGVVTLPVGSKGILFELNVLFSNRIFDEQDIETCLDVRKTSGPATCFLVVHPSSKHSLLSELAGSLFHEVKERSDFDA